MKRRTNPEQVFSDAIAENAARPPARNAAEQARLNNINQAILNFIAGQVPLQKCVLFLGSAIHAPSPKGSKYNYAKDKCPPIGNQLAELLAGNSGYVGDKGDLQRVAQHYEFTLDRKPLVQEIKKLVIDGKEPSPVLCALAAMRFPLVITTNYDNLYERAIDTVNKRRRIAELQAAGQPVDEQAIGEATKGQYDVAIYSRDKNIETKDCAKQLDAERPYILKIHGDISNEKSIVITDEDYIHFVMRMSDKDPYHPVGPNVMTHLIENYILFIGYRLIDYNLRLLFKTLRWKRDAEDVFPAYAIDRDPDYLIRDVWEKQGYMKFVVEDLWDFVTKLYRSVKKEEMPS
jgi:hypothetical protein